MMMIDRLHAKFEQTNVKDCESYVAAEIAEQNGRQRPKIVAQQFGKQRRKAKVVDDRAVLLR